MEKEYEGNGGKRSFVFDESSKRRVENFEENGNKKPLLLTFWAEKETKKKNTLTLSLTGSFSLIAEKEENGQREKARTLRNPKTTQEMVPMSHSLLVSQKLNALGY